jgi:hypothetical protein
MTTATDGKETKPPQSDDVVRQWFAEQYDLARRQAEQRERQCAEAEAQAKKAAAARPARSADEEFAVLAAEAARLDRLKGELLRRQAGRTCRRPTLQERNPRSRYGTRKTFSTSSP